MYKYALDNLLKREVLSQDEYNKFFELMSPNEKGEMIGTMPKGSSIEKYCLDGDLLHGDLLDFVIRNITPPYETDTFNEPFRKYGVAISGISEYWKWFRKGDLTDQEIKNGFKPIDEATELDLWKMIAISSRYWHIYYERIYYNEERNKILFL